MSQRGSSKGKSRGGKGQGLVRKPAAQPKIISLASLGGPIVTSTPKISQSPYRQALSAKQRASERIAERISHISQLLPQSTEVVFYLDLGAGNAEISEGIANYYGAEVVYAVDVYPSSEFIPPSNQTNILYRQYTGILQVPSDSIDLVTAFVSLHHFRPDDYLNGLQEVYRILKPGGYFFIREHDVRTPEKAAELNKIHEQFPHGFGTETHYFSEEELRRILESIGFRFLGYTYYSIEGGPPIRAPEGTPSFQSLPRGRNPQELYHALYQKPY